MSFDLLDRVASGDIDNVDFVNFLGFYGWLWHNCHAEGRIDETKLAAAERGMIAYAERKEFTLTFDGMRFSLTSR